MIKVQNFYKSYDNKNYIVKDVNLHIEKGDCFGFIGHNGAGKTTTIKAICGILEISKGEIFILDNNIKTQPLEAKKQIAYVPDNPDIYENLTGKQYINLVANLFAVSKDDLEKLTQKYSTLLEMEKNLNNLISTYSHGMKQKIVIIASLIHSPKVLILDEPFVGLDPQATYNMKELFKEYCKDGNAILFSTHVLEVAQNICNKIAIIKNGEIVKCGKTKQLLKDKSLEDVFLEN